MLDDGAGENYFRTHRRLQVLKYIVGYTSGEAGRLNGCGVAASVFIPYIPERGSVRYLYLT